MTAELVQVVEEIQKQLSELRSGDRITLDQLISRLRLLERGFTGLLSSELIRYVINSGNEFRLVRGRKGGISRIPNKTHESIND